MPICISPSIHLISAFCSRSRRQSLSVCCTPFWPNICPMGINKCPCTSSCPFKNSRSHVIWKTLFWRSPLPLSYCICKCPQYYSDASGFWLGDQLPKFYLAFSSSGIVGPNCGHSSSKSLSSRQTIAVSELVLCTWDQRDAPLSRLTHVASFILDLSNTSC